MALIDAEPVVEVDAVLVREFLMLVDNELESTGDEVNVSKSVGDALLLVLMDTEAEVDEVRESVDEVVFVPDDDAVGVTEALSRSRLSDVVADALIDSDSDCDAEELRVGLTVSDADC